jgi:hypothetical protein
MSDFQARVTDLKWAGTDLEVIRRRVRNFGRVPLAVALQGLEDLLRVGEDEIGPGVKVRKLCTLVTYTLGE